MNELVNTENQPHQTQESKEITIKASRKFKFAKELLVFLIVLNIGILFSLFYTQKKIDNIPNQINEIQENKSQPTAEITAPTKIIEPIEKKSTKSTKKSVINFEAGKKELTPLMQKELITLFSQLETNQKAKIEVTGHTDDEGSENNNLKISIFRAKLVADYLMELGIDEERIKVTGFGEYYPIADNETENGRMKNRRVEIIIKE